MKDHEKMLADAVKHARKAAKLVEAVMKDSDLEAPADDEEDDEEEDA